MSKVIVKADEVQKAVEAIAKRWLNYLDKDWLMAEIAHCVRRYDLPTWELWNDNWEEAEKMLTQTTAHYILSGQVLKINKKQTRKGAIQSRSELLDLT